MIDTASWEDARKTGAAPHFGTAIAAGASVAGLALAAMLFVLRPLSLLMPARGLDASWMTVLGEAAKTPARWGVDLTFTYGPASALMTRYYTDGYLTSILPLTVAIALTYGWCLERLLATAARGWPTRLAFALVLILGTAAVHLDQDPFYFDLALLVFLVDLTRAGRNRAAALAAASGAVVLGVAAMAKTSFGIVAAPLFVLADLYSVATVRRAPLLTVLFLAGTAATYLAYGQHPADLPDFLRLQWNVAAGYGEAMFLVHHGLEMVVFLIVAGLLLAFLGCSAWGMPADRIRNTVATLGFAFVLLVGFKAGFVRQDTHPQISWLLLGLMGLAGAVTLILPRSTWQAASLSAVSVAILWLAAPALLLNEADAPLDVVNLAATYADVRDWVRAEGDAWGRLARDPAAFAAAARTDKDAAWKAIGTDAPLPRLEGTVDMLASEQSSVLGNGLHYQPRPSFQEYSTYTAGLIAANVGFYTGPSAPDWVFFGLGGLDDRYPNMTEGAIWPLLLRRYQPVARAEPSVVLHRRATPLPEGLGPPVHMRAHLGEPVAVPAGGATFARIIVRETLLGRLASMLFRPSGLTMHLALANGHGQDYRFIPAIAAGGFLLSPRIDDAQQFAMLGLGWSDAPAGNTVAHVAVGGGKAAGLFYEPEIEFAFQPLVVEDDDAGARAGPFARELQDSRAWRLLVERLGLSGSLAGDRLAAPAPKALPFPLGGAPRIHLGFGIEDEAWKTGHPQGVCFALHAPGGETFWKRCLDPAGVVADRGTQMADVDVPPGTAAIVAETTCPKSCDWGWSYWTNMKSGT